MGETFVESIRLTNGDNARDGFGVAVALPIRVLLSVRTALSTETASRTIIPTCPSSSGTPMGTGSRNKSFRRRLAVTCSPTRLPSPPTRSCSSQTHVLHSTAVLFVATSWSRERGSCDRRSSPLVAFATTEARSQPLPETSSLPARTNLAEARCTPSASSRRVEGISMPRSSCRRSGPPSPTWKRSWFPTSGSRRC
jgi:hypothetical protein